MRTGRPRIRRMWPRYRSGHASRPFHFDDTPAAPGFLKQLAPTARYRRWRPSAPVCPAVAGSSGIDAVARAGATSHAGFSMNHAARKKAIGIGNSPNAFCTMPSWLSRFGCAACAPIVDRHTILGGLAASIAVARPRRSPYLGEAGRRVELGGISPKTPSTPVKAAVSAEARSCPRSRPHPRAGHGSPC